MQLIDDIKELRWKDWLAVIAIGGGVGLISGCVDRFLHVDTPQGAVDVGFPERVSLAETGMYQDEFARWSGNVLETWDAREDAKQDTADMISGVAGAILTPEGLAGFGFNPYGGAGASILLLGNMLLGQRRLRREKEASYNAGLAKKDELNAESVQS